MSNGTSPAWTQGRAESDVGMIGTYRSNVSSTELLGKEAVEGRGAPAKSVEFRIKEDTRPVFAGAPSRRASIEKLNAWQKKRAKTLSPTTKDVVEKEEAPAEGEKTLGELGIDPRHLGIGDTVTINTTLNEALALREKFSDAFAVPEEPHLYSEQIASLDRQAKLAGTNLREKTEIFGKAELQLRLEEESLKREQHTAQLEYAEEVNKMSGHKLDIARKEEARIQAIDNESRERLSEYTQGIHAAFQESQEMGSKPGSLWTLGGTLGFTDNDGFAWGKSLSTLFWLTGVFGNTFLSIGTEGKIPNFFLSAMFKAIDSDMKAKSKYAQALGKRGQLARTGLSATIDQFKEEVTRQAVGRSAVFERIDKYLDQFRTDPKMAPFATNPLFQKALSLWKEENQYHKKQSDFSVAQTIRDSVIKETTSRAQILGSASAAQMREFQQKQQKAEILRSMLTSENDKIWELTAEDQRFYGTATKIQDIVQEGLAMVDWMNENDATGQDKLNAIWARMGLAAYFGETAEEHLNKIGQELGRLWARSYDVGNLSQSEQEFGQGQSFLAGHDLSYVEKILRTFESRNITNTMGRFMRTHRSKQDILRPWLSTIGIGKPEMITEDMIDANLLPTESDGYSARAIRAAKRSIAEEVAYGKRKRIKKYQEQK